MRAISVMSVTVRHKRLPLSFAFDKKPLFLYLVRKTKQLRLLKYPNIS